MTQFIYLNGTSSCGKSTIAKAILQIEPKAYLVSADEFGEKFEKSIDTESEIYQSLIKPYNLIEQKISNAPLEKDRTGLFQEYFDLINKNPLPKDYNSDLNMYDYLKSLNGKKDLVIIDDLIATPYLYNYFKNIFADFNMFMVHIVCDVGELKRREQARGDRLIGMAEFWQEKVNFINDYNLVVNATISSPKNLAKEILTQLE